MKITSLLTKQFAILIIIILLSSSVLAEKILVFGDSHYAGTYGKTLDKLLKNVGYGVESYGCVSATAQHYIDGGKHCVQPLQGSTHNSIQEDYYLKPVNDYLTSIFPNIVIISLGGNIEAVSTLKFVREKQISDLVKFITDKNIKCIWVGPPGKEDPDKAKERDIFYDQLKEALGNSCTLIDSRTYAQLKISDTSGHFPSGDQRAKNWAQSVFNDFKSIQGGTFSPSSLPPSSPSSSSSVNILHIGDSHTAISTYGTELQKLLLTTGATVNTYARSGSTPQNWLDGTTGTSFYINNNGARKSTSDSFNLKDLKSQFNPNIIIITLGTNIISSNTLKTQSEQLAKLAVQGGTKCYWIGPPKITTNLKDKLDQAIVDINSAVSPYCTFIDSKPLSDENKLNSDGIHYNNDGGKEWAQSVFNEFKSKQGSITPGIASGAKTSNLPSSSTKIIQSTCNNQQSCKEIDEVWASRIGAFVNPDLSNKVYAVPGGWVPFEQLYAQPKPVIATVDTYIPPTTTTTKQSSKLTEEQKSFVKTYAAQEGVDEKLALTLINAESAGNIKAISPTGCSGLMQICGGSSPKDIIQVQCTQKKSLGETQCDKDSCHVATGGFNWCDVCSEGKNCAPDDRFNPEKNIQSGVRIIKGKLQSTTGCKTGVDATKCAIAAYNIGSSPIKAAATAAGSNPTWEDVNTQLTIDLVRSHGYSSWSDSQIQSKINQLNPYVQKIYANAQS